MWIFGRKKVKLPNNYINMRCIHCGSSTDTDLEHIQVYCPFCGEELYVRAGEYRNLYEKATKKEQT